MTPAMVAPALTCLTCQGDPDAILRPVGPPTSAPVSRPRYMRVPCPACGGDGRRGCDACQEAAAVEVTPEGALCEDCLEASPLPAA